MMDFEFVEVLSEANVNFLTLPFESASQRIIDKYAQVQNGILTDWILKNYSGHLNPLISKCLEIT